MVLATAGLLWFPLRERAARPPRVHQGGVKEPNPVADPVARAKAAARRALPSNARSKVGAVARRAGIAGQRTAEPLTLWRARLAEQVAVTTDVRVAFAGCGAQARNLAGALVTAGATVAAAFDQRPGVADAFLADHGGVGVAHESLSSLLEGSRDWSVLVIATTAASHVEITTAALEAGVDRILIEKPVATNVAEARALDEVARAKGALVAVDHTRRWLPSSQGLRRLAASGAIGEVRSINFMWGRNGFAMVGTHLFDLARLITGSDVAWVQCDLDPNLRVTWRGAEFVDQPGFATGAMTDGTRICVDLSSDLDTQQGYAVIVGATGRIEVDEMLGKVRMVGTGKRVWETDYGFRDCLAIGGAKAVVDLHEGKAPPCTIADGIAALEATVACQVSSAAGGSRVSLPLSDDEAGETYPFA